MDINAFDLTADEPINNQTFTSTPSSTSSGCNSGDENYDQKKVPSSIITAYNYLTISDEALALSSVEDLSKAVQQCKSMVLDSSERSEERKWLVRRLIELRLRLQDVRDAAVQNNELNTQFGSNRVLMGHHFEFHSQISATNKQHCDRCGGIIWSMLQYSYQCSDCQYRCHIKCISQVSRLCAHVRASENPNFINDICPEIGLSTQGYKCHECKGHITFTFPKGLTCFGLPFTSENTWIEPRICDYDGRYYCPSCHWNSWSVIPARIIHNWDFQERRVSRSSRQLLQLMFHRPIIRLEELNPKLFALIEELSLLKKYRQDVLIMKKYFVLCKDATNEHLLRQLKDRTHFTENVDIYSLQDLVDLKDGLLIPQMEKIMVSFITHIKENCKLCSAKGYLCELCGNNEVIFPFDGGIICCIKCNAAFHKNCWAKKNQNCPKCIRKEKRESLIIPDPEIEESNLF